MKGRTPKLRNKLTPSQPLGPPPDWLPAEAQALYRGIAESADTNLCELDGYALSMYSLAYIRWQQAEADVTANGITLDGRLNPATKVASDMLRQLLRFGGELGLTPLARGRIQAEPVTPQIDEFEKLKQKYQQIEER